MFGYVWFYCLYFVDSLLLFAVRLVLDDVVWLGGFGFMLDFVRWCGCYSDFWLMVVVVYLLLGVAVCVS